jgi:hypothetical protein
VHHLAGAVKERREIVDPEKGYGSQQANLPGAMHMRVFCTLTRRCSKRQV